MGLKSNKWTPRVVFINSVGEKDDGNNLRFFWEEWAQPFKKGERKIELQISRKAKEASNLCTETVGKT